jgi:hypothetical protein
MQAFEIQPIREPDLQAVADFVRRSRHGAPDSGTDDAAAPAGSTTADYLEVLRWRTQLNPARPAELELGHAIRGAEGAVAGVHIICPFRYRGGDRRFAALASSTFYADPEVRIQAFFLFRRYLALPGFEFYFANTCNVSSGRVWEKCGGRMAPASDSQWLLPLRMAPLVRELLVRRHRRAVAQVAAPLAAMVDWMIPRRRSCELALEPTADLELLAHTADRWRNPKLLTPDRDLSYLQWQFVAGQASRPKQAYRFVDSQGRDGWVAVGERRAGVDGNLRVVTLLDWAAPPMDFATIVRSAGQRFADSGDAIVFRSRPDISLESHPPRLRRQTYPYPTCFLIPAQREQKGWEEQLVTSQADAV